MIEWPPCVLPRAIEEALDSAHEISELIDKHHPASFEMSVPGCEIASVMYSIAIDHRAATLLLISHNARSPAFALARSVLEAYLRGMWAQHCATEREVQEVFEHHRMPTIDTMVKRLDRIKELRKAVGDQKRIMWEPL